MMNTRIKQAVGVFILIIVAIAVTKYLWTLHVTGKLLIKASDPQSQIQVSQSSSTFTGKGKGSYSARLKPGLYQVLVTSSGKATMATAKVALHQTTSLSLSLANPAQTLQVADYNAGDIQASAAGLTFINKPFEQFYQFTFGDSRAWRYLPDIYPIEHAVWLKDGEALVQYRDGGWGLVQNGAAHPLSLVGSGDTPTPPSSLDVNQNGEILYVANNQLFYRASPSGADQPLQKLGQVLDVSISDNGMALLFQPEAGIEKQTAIKNEVLNIHSGTVTKTGLPNEIITNAVWSDGGELAIASASGITVVDSSGSSSQVMATSPNHPGSLTWLDDKRLLFAQDNSAWIYNTSTDVSVKVADLSGPSAGRFAVSPDSTTVYFGTDDGIIHKFSL